MEDDLVAYRTHEASSGALLSNKERCFFENLKSKMWCPPMVTRAYELPCISCNKMKKKSEYTCYKNTGWQIWLNMLPSSTSQPRYFDHRWRHSRIHSSRQPLKKKRVSKFTLFETYLGMQPARSSTLRQRIIITLCTVCFRRTFSKLWVATHLWVAKRILVGRDPL